MPQVPLVCHGHSRPIVALEYSRVTPDGVFLISSSKDGQPMLRCGDSGDSSNHDGGNGSSPTNNASSSSSNSSRKQQQ